MKPLLAILTAIMIIGCSATDRTTDRRPYWSEPEKTNEPKLARISINCQCPDHSDPVTGAKYQDQSCGIVKVQGNEVSTCLPFYDEIFVKSGDVLSVQYLTSSTTRHQILVSLPDTSYGKEESGTVSLLEKIH